MYLSELIPVVDALQSLVGTPLTGVRQSRRDRVLLEFGDRRLHLVPRGPFARLGERLGRQRSPASPFSFQGACRAHLSGRLRALSLVDGDRDVLMAFDRGSLRLRLTGRGGGLWLLDGDEVVAAYDGPAKTLPELPPSSATERAPRFDASEEPWPVAAERFFARRESQEAAQQEEQRLRRGLKSERDRLLRLVRHLDKDARSASNWPDRRRAADALAAVLWKVERGMRNVTVQDLEDPDTVHRLTLQPSLGPGANLTRLYERAKRLQLRSEAASDKRTTALAALNRVDAASEALDAGDSAPAQALVPVRTALRAGRPEDAGIEVWQGPGGLEVWVGRNAMANRRLTFQKARGRDWWMHVRSRPGSHAILPMRGRTSPHLEWLLAAAQIVARRSRVATGASCDVQYTQVKHVQALPGDAHGRVRVHEEKVLHITVEETLPDGWTQAP